MDPIPTNNPLLLPLTSLPTTYVGPWCPVLNASGPFQKIPTKIFSKIASYLPCSKTYPNCLTKEVLFSLSLTCRFFRHFFRNDVYFAIKITSPNSLAEFVDYLNAHTWPGQLTAIKRIVLRWPQETTLPSDQFLLASSFSCPTPFQRIAHNIHLLLEAQTASLEVLTLDFPKAVIHFQAAMLYGQGFFGHQHPKLKRLDVNNGLCPLLTLPTFLLCSISALCARSLEELIIDGGCLDLENSRTSSHGLSSSELVVPGVRMFHQYENFQRLRELHVKNLPGFNERCLNWMLSGEKMQSSNISEGKRVLRLESNPNLANDAIGRALESMKGGFEELCVTAMQEEDTRGPVPGMKSLAARPSAWSWSSEETTEATGEDDAFSFVGNVDSATSTLERATSETNDGENYHPDSFSVTKHSRGYSYDTASRSSSKAYRHHQAGRSYQSTYSSQSNSDNHTYGTAHNACKNLKSLGICSRTICQTHQYHRSSNTAHCFPLSARFPTPLFEDTDANYINQNLATFHISSLPPPNPNPAANALPTPPASLHPTRDSSVLKPSEVDTKHEDLQISLQCATGSNPGSLSEVRDGGVTKLRAEVKRLSRFADGILQRSSVGSFAKLQGLWKWKGCKAQGGEEI